MSVKESELLARIAERSRDLYGRGPIVLGPGDDAAVLNLPGLTLATVDHLVAGVHVDAALTTIDQIARKAVARSVSDIAAMGGTPACALATGCLPRGYTHADELFDRLAFWARHWRCPLAGGDIAVADGPLVLTITVLGRAHERRGPVLRSGARPGDAVFLTGAIGDSFRSGRHLSFEPRLAEASWLCETLGERLHAMIDLSDGLGRDAAHVARASGVHIGLESERFPLRKGVASWRRAIAEGEDYELLFTVADDAAVPDRCPASGESIARIGRVIPGEGCVVRMPDGESFSVEHEGWDHAT
jgi:thiamine-monophosphate kinase